MPTTALTRISPSSPPVSGLLSAPYLYPHFSQPSTYVRTSPSSISVSALHPPYPHFSQLPTCIRTSPSPLPMSVLLPAPYLYPHFSQPSTYVRTSPSSLPVSALLLAPYLYPHSMQANSRSPLWSTKDSRSKKGSNTFIIINIRNIRDHYEHFHYNHNVKRRDNNPFPWALEG